MKAPPGLGDYRPLDSGVVQVGGMVGRGRAGPAPDPELLVDGEDLALNRAQWAVGGPGPRGPGPPSGVWRRGLG